MVETGDTTGHFEPPPTATAIPSLIEWELDRYKTVRFSRHSGRGSEAPFWCVEGTHVPVALLSPHSAQRITRRFSDLREQPLSESGKSATVGL